MDMRRIWPEVVDDTPRDRVDRAVRIRFFERPRVAERVVDANDPKPIGFVCPHCVLWPIPIRLAREHENVVSMRHQRPRVHLGVNFAATLCRRRKSVDDDQNAHQTALDWRGCELLTAERAPTYWASGHANASVIARRLTSQRAWVTTQEAIARARWKGVGMVRTPNSSYSRRWRARVRSNS